MHPEAREWVEKFVEEYAPFRRVIEIGSRNVNGSVRDLFGDSEYVGIDIREGPEVDWVGDAVDYPGPKYLVDCIVNCETLEHARNWRKIIQVSSSWLAADGYMVITCAGPRRPPHSAVDGGALRPGEYYGTISVGELHDELMTAGLKIVACRRKGRDTRAVACR